MDLKDKALAVACGNRSAADLVLLIDAITGTWDDLIDKDVPVSDADINLMMWRALIDLPRNAFYQEHFAGLNAIFTASIYSWMAATELERGTHREKQMAFVLRYGLLDLVVHIALLCGGYEWARQVSIDVRHWHKETFDEYLARLDGK